MILKNKAMLAFDRIARRYCGIWFCWDPQQNHIQAWFVILYDLSSPRVVVRGRATPVVLVSFVARMIFSGIGCGIFVFVILFFLTWFCRMRSVSSLSMWRARLWRTAIVWFLFDWGVFSAPHLRVFVEELSWFDFFLCWLFLFTFVSLTLRLWISLERSETAFLVDFAISSSKTWETHLGSDPSVRMYLP